MSPHVSLSIMWGPLLAYVLLPGCPPLGSRVAGCTPCLLRLHCGPFGHVFGSPHCLNFVHSFLHRLLLSHPLCFHVVGTGVCFVAFGLLCARLTASFGFGLFFLGFSIRWGRVLYSNLPMETCTAWPPAVSLPGPWLCYSLNVFPVSLAFSALRFG